jgi:thymidylate synthase
MLYQPDKDFRKILGNILENGIKKQNRTGIDTLSIFNTTWDSSDLLEHGYFPLMTCRKYFFKGALVELFWILNILQSQNPIEGLSRTNVAYLQRENVHYWDKWADSNGDLGPVYGYQLTNWSNSINQIQNIIDTLRTNPDDRRLVFSMWNPAELNQMALPPCHWGGEFYSEPTSIGKRKLHLRWIQRSCDFPVGVPYDISMYALLLVMISKLTNHTPGKIIGLFGDTHIYENQINGVREMLCAPDILPPRLVYSGTDNVENLNDFKLDWFNITGYNPYKTIELPVAL